MITKCPDCIAGLVPKTQEVCNTCGGTAELVVNDTPMQEQEEKKDTEATPEAEAAPEVEKTEEVDATEEEAAE